MPYLDLILIVPLLWGMYRGFKRGFIIEVCTFMALILGVYGAATFGDMGGDYLVKEYKTDPQLSLIIAFAVLFVGIVVVVFLFGKMLESVIKMVALSVVNKIAGLIIGLAKFALIVSALLFVWNGFPATAKLIPDSWKKGSYLYEPLSQALPTVYPVLKEQDWTDKLEEHFEELKDQVEL